MNQLREAACFAFLFVTEIRVSAAWTQQRYKISITKSLRNLFTTGGMAEGETCTRSYLPTLETHNYRVPRFPAIGRDVRTHLRRGCTLFTSRPNRYAFAQREPVDGCTGEKEKVRLAAGFINRENDEVTREYRLRGRSTLRSMQSGRRLSSFFSRDNPLSDVTGNGESKTLFVSTIQHSDREGMFPESENCAEENWPIIEIVRSVESQFVRE